ncbi:hypothetical protein PLESTB_001283600 [Pleodorina starrii]|uniref:Uncharacterized protein n=1 Tax=Pleodorina starrii TaxID=330485 RepID=A0A9W6BTN8_9CHLO|nr:hypothetical protein PLESTM_000243000 [Pleodorina starrii]GLC38777.1 hypothetical protein PLESTM_000774700 [Pleodorina starrii]GLC46916.1 hypothetical protein PLESTM_001944800 [Pleodorina starrii]GLC57873.1 hypothetical protein PLESTB_001283600 [Pleodorina starrii]GLC69942.1 hypothetical protein PLESTF_000901300 [Pleodorina starrii]
MAVGVGSSSSSSSCPDAGPWALSCCRPRWATSCWVWGSMAGGSPAVICSCRLGICDPSDSWAWLPVASIAVNCAVASSAAFWAFRSSVFLLRVSRAFCVCALFRSARSASGRCSSRRRFRFGASGPAGPWSGCVRPCRGCCLALPPVGFRPLPAPVRPAVNQKAGAVAAAAADGPRSCGTAATAAVDVLAASMRVSASCLAAMESACASTPCWAAAAVGSGCGAEGSCGCRVGGGGGSRIRGWACGGGGVGICCSWACAGDWACSCGAGGGGGARGGGGAC